MKRLQDAIASLAAEHDALVAVAEAAEEAANWLCRSTRIDDRDQADDLRAALATLAAVRNGGAK